MGYMIEITESKVEHLAENIGKMLHYGGMAMQCVEEIRHEAGLGYGERHGGYAERGGYGRSIGMREHEMPHDGMDERVVRPDGYPHMDDRYPHMGERHHEGWVDDPYFMGERRGRSSVTGRYMRR